MASPDHIRIRDYVRKLDGPAVAVFDIGTRAARILVAPRQVPDTWGEKTFCSAGYVMNLGQDVTYGADVLPLSAISLRNVRSFIKSHVQNLRALGVTDISILGTAVFRWLHNREEILQLIENDTGVRLECIEETREAELTLRTIPEAHVRRRSNIDIGENDKLIVFDQGGGSFDIAWMDWSERTAKRPNLRFKNFPRLGAVALRRKFFNTDKDGRSIDDPTKNESFIRVQADRIRDIAYEEFLTEFRGVPTPQPGSRVFAYAVGTSITKLFPNATAYEVHNKLATKERLSQFLEAQHGKFKTSTRRVLTAYKKLHGIPGKGVNDIPGSPADLDRELALLYGLPAYIEALERCRLSEIRVSGYPLRFGHYLSRCLWEDPFCAVQSDTSGPYAFLSYARKNATSVYSEIALLDSMRYRVWYDQSIGAGDWSDQIAAAIDGCEIFVSFMTPETVASEPCFNETLYAKQKGKPILYIDLHRVETPGKWTMRFGDPQRINRNSHEATYRSKLSTCIPTSCLRASS